MRSNAQNTVCFKLLLWIFPVCALIGCGGGGGGGGNSGTPVTVKGRILRAETDQPTLTAATIAIAGQTITAGADGTFTTTVSSGTTSATITATNEASRTITFALATPGPDDLGDIFLSDTGYTAKLSGRVVTLVNNTPQPVGSALVTIANVTVTTLANGTFTLNGLPVGLGGSNGNYGLVMASGFDNKVITADNLGGALAAGMNTLPFDLVLTRPSGSVPLPPFTISGAVALSPAPGSAVPITVTLLSNATPVATTLTDASGNYTFWVVPGSYTVTVAAQGYKTSAPITVVLQKLDVPVTASTITLVP